MRRLKKLAILSGLAFFFTLVGALVSYYPQKRHFQAKLEALKPKEVQVIQRDTITAYLPLEIKRRVMVRDTIAIVHLDTLWRTDTLYLPREQVVYEDSSYRAVVSGISPRLDSIEVYNKTIIETKIATQKEWRKFDYGVQVGIGAVSPFGGSPSLGYYAGLGITFRF